uniref:Uncharacterized protein n=1 Tax=Meloidogyne floridensis TaxID=298350 RepID=A0A915NY60_9BILA
MSVKIHPKIVVDTGNGSEKNTKIKNDKSNENNCNYCSNNASNSASLYFSTQQHKQFRKSMAQDAEDGPDFLDVEQHRWDLNSNLYNNNTSRPPMNQVEKNF